MRSHYNRLFTVLALVSIAVGPGIGPGAQTNAQSKRLHIILVSHGVESDFFWKPVFKGAEDAGRIFGVEVTWLGGYPMGPVLERAIAARPDGLGITGLEPDVTRYRLTQLVAAGTPIILFNVDDPYANDPMKRLPYLFYIGTDDIAAGQSNARAALKAAKGIGRRITRAVCVVAFSGVVSFSRRCAGYADEMKTAGAVVDLLVASGPSAVEMIADYFDSHPDCTAINTTDAELALEFQLYVKDADKRPGDIFHTTHDTSVEVLDAIEHGMTLQASDQQPYYQGFGTVEWLWLYLNYKLVPANDILTGRSIDQSNVALTRDLLNAGYR